MRSGPRSSSRSRGKRRRRCAPAEATPVPDGGARLGAYARGSHCRRGGDDSRRCWFPETTVDEQSSFSVAWLPRIIDMCICLWALLRQGFLREGCGTSFRAAHTRRDHGRARQARHRPQAHPHLPRCAARHLRELHEVHRGRYETSRKDTRSIAEPTCAFFLSGPESRSPDASPRAGFRYAIHSASNARSVAHVFLFITALARKRLSLPRSHRRVPVHHLGQRPRLRVRGFFPVQKGERADDGEHEGDSSEGRRRSRKQRQGVPGVWHLGPVQGRHHFASSWSCSRTNSLSRRRTFARFARGKRRGRVKGKRMHYKGVSATGSSRGSCSRAATTSRATAAAARAYTGAASRTRADGGTSSTRRAGCCPWPTSGPHERLAVLPHLRQGEVAGRATRGVRQVTKGMEHLR